MAICITRLAVASDGFERGGLLTRWGFYPDVNPESMIEVRVWGKMRQGEAFCTASDTPTSLTPQEAID